jgi:hypothetical protein
MLDHLLAQEHQPLTEAALSFVPLDQATPKEILEAKVSTDDWLKALGAEDHAPVDPVYEKALAAQAFGSVASPSASPAQKRDAVMQLRTSESIRKISDMLSAYEWSFVDQAKELRSYIVSGLVEETKNPKPEVRLKAYKLLGEVTEVALFTQRTEIISSKLSDKEVEEEIRKRLERLTVNAPIVERVDPDTPHIKVDDE